MITHYGAGRQIHARSLGWIAGAMIAATLAFAQQASAAPPTYQAAGTIQPSTRTTLSVPWPAQAIGDIGLLIIETQNQAVTLGTNAANWNPVTNSWQGTGTTNNTGTRLTVFWSRATSTSMGNVGLTGTGMDHQIAQIITFRGVVATGNPWDVTAGDVTASTTTAVSIPGATTTVQDTLVVAIVSNGSDLSAAQIPGSFTNSDLSSVTKRQDNQTTASGGGGFAVATGSKALAGAYGPTSATLGFSSLQGRMSIALRPPFTKLQLLVPGETAAPGTGSGKTGTPNAQTAGTAFTVTVNAVDANWNVMSSTDTVGITSTDTNATLPGNAALASGTQTFNVTLKTAGTKTLTASDITTPAKTPDTSLGITVNPGVLNNFLVEKAGGGGQGDGDHHVDGDAVGGRDDGGVRVGGADLAQRDDLEHGELHAHGDERVERHEQPVHGESGSAEQLPGGGVRGRGHRDADGRDGVQHQDHGAGREQQYGDGVHGDGDADIDGDAVGGRDDGGVRVGGADLAQRDDLEHGELHAHGDERVERHEQPVHGEAGSADLLPDVGVRRRCDQDAYDR